MPCTFPIQVKTTGKSHIPVTLESFCLICSSVIAIFHLVFTVKGETSVQTGRFSLQPPPWKQLPQPPVGHSLLEAAGGAQQLGSAAEGGTGQSQWRDSNTVALLWAWGVEGASAQERHGPTGEGPEEEHRNEQRDGAPLL